jgi:predicted RNase H-like HicB family nuclease
MKNLHLPLVIEEDEDGVFIISCPSFKGCHSYGKTIDVALTNIRDVIDLCLEERIGF